MMKLFPLIRCRDSFGAGYFGAGRGGRPHNGIDVCSNLPDDSSVGIFVKAFKNGDAVKALRRGTVTKLGYPYANHLEYRYVEITDPRGYRARYFYVDPSVSVGDDIDAGDCIGHLQDTGKLYQDITPHVHFEVVTGKRPNRTYHDPMKYLAGDI